MTRPQGPRVKGTNVLWFDLADPELARDPLRFPTNRRQEPYVCWSTGTGSDGYDRSQASPGPAL